jgi:hypothetical protein
MRRPNSSFSGSNPGEKAVRRVVSGVSRSRTALLDPARVSS